MNIPEDLLYTKDHEWICIINGIATIGVTDYAQGELGDIVFIELPDIDVKYKAGDSVAVIEAVKTVSDIYTPIEGKISDVNLELEDNPELINKSPYEKGWIVKMCNISKNVSDLLQSSEYRSLIQ